MELGGGFDSDRIAGGWEGSAPWKRIGCQQPASGIIGADCAIGIARRAVAAIEESRTSRGISVAALARFAEIDCRRLRLLLRGERAMKADELVRLCFILGVSPGGNPGADAHRVGEALRGKR